MGGLTLVICAGALVTLNNPVPVTGVPLVVTVTSRGPTVAPGAIVRFAVKLTPLLNDTPFTVIPLPKLTVEPALKLVFDPLIVTLNVSPCWPNAGVTLRIGGIGVTVNSPAPISATPPVETVTSRGPGVALPSIVIFAPKLVGLLNDTEFTVTPAPKLTADPELKLVPCPVITTLSVWPCWPVPGVTLEICCGGACRTVNRLIPITGDPSVVTVTLRAPSVASASIRMFAVIVVALLNWTESTMIPDPKLMVDDGEKFVFCPAITTASD